MGTYLYLWDCRIRAMIGFECEGGRVEDFEALHELRKIIGNIVNNLDLQN